MLTDRLFFGRKCILDIPLVGRVHLCLLGSTMSVTNADLPSAIQTKPKYQSQYQSTQGVPVRFITITYPINGRADG